MKCTRCGGTGNLPHYVHVEMGVCFRCRGTGIDPEPEYTGAGGWSSQPDRPISTMGLYAPKMPLKTVTVVRKTAAEVQAYLDENRGVFSPFSIERLEAKIKALRESEASS